MELKIINCAEPKPGQTPPLLKDELYRADTHDFNLVKVDAGFSKPPHPYAAGDSFMLVISGLLHLHVEEKTYDLKPGDVAFIPKGAVRGFTGGPEGASFFAAHLRG